MVGSISSNVKTKYNKPNDIYANEISISRSMKSNLRSKNKFPKTRTQQKFEDNLSSLYFYQMLRTLEPNQET